MDPVPTTPAPNPRAAARIQGLFLLLLCASLPLFLLLATERFTLPARLIAWAGFWLALAPAATLIARRGARMNGVAAVGLVVALFYPLAVFHEEKLPLRWGDARISNESVEIALLLAALATPAMWAGWLLGGAVDLGRLLPRPRLSLNSGRLRAMGLAIVGWSFAVNILWLSGLLTRPATVVGLIGLLSPLDLGFAMLLVYRTSGPASIWDRMVIPAVLGLAGVLALAGGVMMFFIRPMLIYFLWTLYLRRRAAVMAIVGALMLVLVLQPVKADFRQQVWDRQVEMGFTDRALLYIDLLQRHWLGGEFDPTVNTAESARVAASRTAGALTLANYVELTPSTVPYQWGTTYRYLLSAFVPRIIDPDKPIAQIADVWAAVMYGFTSQQMTSHVMVGLSQIGEAYINFGFFGALLMLMVIGFLYRGVDEVLAHPRAGLGALALYLYYLQSIMLSSEGSFAQFWGGAVQIFVFYGLCIALVSDRGRTALVASP